MITTKGSSITKTSIADTSGQDLFSHPYTYQWHGNEEPVDGRSVSRKNLFSESAAPRTPPGDSDGKRPPRNPFDVN